MRWLALIIFLFLIPLVLADTTFFDNPDGVFIMNSPATDRAVATTTGETTGGGGCRYEWNCTNWSECLESGKQIRDCVNIGTCSDTYKTPETEQNCSYTAPEVEEEGGEKEETEEIIWKEIVNKIFICFIIVLIIGFVIFYLKKDYFKKLIKKFK